MRDNAVLPLEHGKPLLFGKSKERGIRLNGLVPEVVKLEGGVTEKDLLVWDEKMESPTMAFSLAQLEEGRFPMPIGVFRCVELPTYERAVHGQIRDAVSKQGPGDLKKLIYSGDLWDVKPG